MQGQEAKQRYLDAQPNLFDEPDWAKEIRRRGVDRFTKMDWPHQRQEAWRFTDVSPVIEAKLRLQPGIEEIQEEAVRQWRLEDADSELIFLNGRYVLDLSRRAGAATDLGRAVLEGGPAVRGHLDAHIQPTDAFVALNAALMGNGAFVHVPKGRDGGLVHVLHVSAGKIASHPRVLIALERGAECHVVETYAGLGGGGLSNSVVEVYLEEDARLDYAKVVSESNEGYHLGAMQVVQNRSSRFSSTSVTFSGRITRNALNVALEGEGAETYLHGLYIADGERLADNALRVSHAAPRCLSRIAYRGILDGAGRGVFTGDVVVERGAQYTDSNQVNNNLVLSDEARVDTKPQLQIFADDVKCTHGATIGQPSEEAVYYFKTRGIGEAEARRMLTCGFAAEIVNGLKVQSLKDRLTRQIFTKFSS